MKRLARTLIRRTGYDIARLNPEGSLGIFAPMILRHLDIQCVIDVGAHFGEYATVLRENGYCGYIVSFEPVFDSFSVLQKQCNKDSKWTCHQLALGDAAGFLEINVMSGTVFSSFLSASDYGSSRFAEGLQVKSRNRVEVVRLDEIVDRVVPPEAGRNVYLKMDTQGYDLRVVAGSTGCIERIAALQSEMSIQPLYDAMPTFIESIQYLQSLGFDISGVFNLHRDDQLRLGEIDCVMVRTRAASASSPSAGGAGRSPTSSM